MQNCSFCLEPSILTCMNRSLYNKHKQQQRQIILIDKLITREKSNVYYKFIELNYDIDRNQHIAFYLKGKSIKTQYTHLLEYYKYRIFVPVFKHSRPTETILTFYYEKLKKYYNQIKKRLNMTIDPSSITESYEESVESCQESNDQSILKSIKKQFEEEKKINANNILGYKTQSKALQQMISYLKLNQKFENVQSLNTQDCQQKQDSKFNDTLWQNNKKLKLNLNDDSNYKFRSKLFKRIIEGVAISEKKTYIEGDVTKQPRPLSRENITKRVAQNESKLNSYRIKQKSGDKNIKSTTSLKRISFNKIESQNSPYKKKCNSLEKIKGTQIQYVKKNQKQNVERVKVIKLQSQSKIKQAMTKMNLFKYLSETGSKTMPNSPKIIKGKNTIEIICHQDNLLNIRKKKVEVLKNKMMKR